MLESSKKVQTHKPLRALQPQTAHNNTRRQALTTREALDAEPFKSPCTHGIQLGLNVASGASGLDMSSDGLRFSCSGLPVFTWEALKGFRV